MKKTLALLLAILTLALPLASCNDSKSPDNTGDSTHESEVTTPAEDSPNLPSAEEIDGISDDFTISVAGNYANNDFKAEGEEGTTV